MKSLLRCPRALCLASLTLVFGLQLLTEIIYSFNRGTGDPDLTTVLSILPPDSGSLLRVDLGLGEQSDPDQTLHIVALPERWRSGLGGTGGPPLRMVFVDDQRIEFQRKPPAMPDGPGTTPRAYCREIDRTGGELIVPSPATVCCGTAAIVIDDATLAVAVPRNRIRHLRLRSVATLLAFAVWTGVDFRVARSAPVVHLAIGCGLFFCALVASLTDHRFCHATVNASPGL